VKEAAEFEHLRQFTLPFTACFSLRLLCDECGWILRSVFTCFQPHCLFKRIELRLPCWGDSTAAIVGTARLIRPPRTQFLLTAHQLILPITACINLKLLCDEALLPLYLQPCCLSVYINPALHICALSTTYLPVNTPCQSTARILRG
jgi:hypothetical protein